MSILHSNRTWFLLKFVTNNYGDMGYTFIKLLGNPMDLTYPTDLIFKDQYT